MQVVDCTYHSLYYERPHTDSAVYSEIVQTET